MQVVPPRDVQSYTTLETGEGPPSVSISLAEHPSHSPDVLSGPRFEDKVALTQYERADEYLPLPSNVRHPDPHMRRPWRATRGRGGQSMWCGDPLRRVPAKDCSPSASPREWPRTFR